MRKILVTGGYGFIGSEVVNVAFTRLSHLEKLVVIDRIDYCSRPDNIVPDVRKDPRFSFIRGDLCDFNLIKNTLEEFQIDTVIHMAAQTHVDRSFYDSLQFSRDNILGTHTLLEACRKYGKLNRFVHMSTDEVYGESSMDEDSPFEEISVLNPTNPYAATKAGAEFLVRSYGHSYKLPFLIIRGNNVYGHGQFPDKLIPKVILYLHLGLKVPIHGKGTAKRTFVHVTDMANGILTVAEKGNLSHIYNVGSRNEYTVMEIVSLLARLLKKDLDTSITYVQDRNFNDCRYHIDFTKVHQLGWEEQVLFAEGIASTIKWYLDRVDEFKSRL